MSGFFDITLFFSPHTKHPNTQSTNYAINKMEPSELTSEQIIMILVFVVIPLGLIGMVILFSFASCCGFKIAVISPLRKRSERKKLGNEEESDDTYSTSSIGYQYEYDEHQNDSTDGDIELGMVKTPPPKRYSLVRFVSNLGKK